MRKPVVSHYRILEQLGDGGMGLVFKAQDTRLERPVALKFLPKDLILDPVAKQRFLREARLASQLDHVNVCTIYEVDETKEGQLFIAMAFCDGESVSRKLARGPLPVEEAVSVAVQVARGLRHAHRLGVVHRDIKPANVIVSKRGKARVIDFGLAKAYEEAEGSSLTQSGIFFGTPSYVSPEQINERTVDHRSDIWSLGILLYEMLTGRHAFWGEYPTTIIYAVLRAQPAPISEFRPGLPAGIQALVDKTLQKDPNDRYGDFGELLKDMDIIRRRLDGAEVVAEAGDGQSWPWVERLRHFFSA